MTSSSGQPGASVFAQRRLTEFLDFVGGIGQRGGESAGVRGVPARLN
jgi:hypothetical protein